MDHQKGLPLHMTLISTISELKANWINLHDLDRAKAIRTIHIAGISIRQIANQLQMGESSLRRLLVALDAPIADKFLARKGKLTTNELVRRSKAAGLKRVALHREEIALEQAREALKAAGTICEWLRNKGVGGSFGEQIIERSQPKRAIDDNADPINWYHEWLCRWAFFAFPDPEVRDTALDKALQAQWAR